VYWGIAVVIYAVLRLADIPFWQKEHYV
jgi:hypothetical protein